MDDTLCDRWKPRIWIKSLSAREKPALIIIQKHAAIFKPLKLRDSPGSLHKHEDVYNEEE